VACILRIKKAGRITHKPTPEACILMKSNSGAEMTVMNLRHFFGWGVGHVPKYLIVFRADMSRNATQQEAGRESGFVLCVVITLCSGRAVSR